MFGKKKNKDEKYYDTEIKDKKELNEIERIADRLDLLLLLCQKRG